MPGKEDNKRKKESTSSVSDNSMADNSMSEDQTNETKLKAKQNKKKVKVDNQDKPQNEESQASYVEPRLYKELQKELQQINERLNSMLKKDDTYIKDMMKDVLKEMKDELLKSVTGRIEKLEGTLFDKEQENDALKKEIIELRKEVETVRDEKNQLKRDSEKMREINEGKINDLEQYGRRNNIRISGLEDSQHETAEQTTAEVINTINREMPGVNLKFDDIDIAHRLGKFDKDKQRQIIVKMKSRMTKINIMTRKKALRGKHIFINDDLTKLNQAVFKSVRVKNKDHVSSAWTQDGVIKYRDHNDHIQTVNYTNFHYWLNLPWP